MKRKLYWLGVLFILFFDDVSAQAPNWAWAKSAGGSGYDNGYASATDASGNVLVMGNFGSASITFGTTTLTKTGGYDIFIVKYDALGNVLWAKSEGGAGNEFGNAIATDANGNVLVTGSFASPSITFGTTTLTNADSTDIFIVKYDASGNVLWAKSAGGTGLDETHDIATDAGGNVVVTGFYTSPSITFGTTALTNAGSNDIFIVKYDAAGNVLWAKSAGGVAYDNGSSITTDASGNLLATGYFRSDSITFGTTALTNVNAGTNDLFIVKYDGSGNVLWAQSGGSTKDDVSMGIAIDISGNVLINGQFFSDSITFGTTVLINHGGSAYTDILIVKYDGSGNVLWAKSAGGMEGDGSNSIATDATGSVLVTGYFQSDSVTIGTTVLTNAGSGPTSDIFLIKYDAAGNVLWSKSAGGTTNDYSYGISNDASGNAQITGYFQSPSITFGTITLINAGSYDFFIARLDNTTGLADASTPLSMTGVFPNPTTNLLHLSLTKPLPPNTTIIITDMQGRVIKEVSKITHGGDAIDVSTLTQGVYLLKVNGQVQRFVKM